MKEKIFFKVSARTARLIGRENVATSKGAIIELVKNGYDADSQFSLVFIDNHNATYHEEISVSDYSLYVERGIPNTLLDAVYHYDKESNRRRGFGLHPPFQRNARFTSPRRFYRADRTAFGASV